jgi:chloramphenicol 3-O phosphotransferase
MENKLKKDNKEIKFGIDKLIWALPRRYIDTSAWHQVFEYHWHDTPAGSKLEICAGPLGKQLFSGMHHAIAALAESGLNVIADHVLIEPEWVAECARLFQGLPAYLIGVRCVLEILEERERARKDGGSGQAKADRCP